MHDHYFKDVSNFQRVDVYRVLRLFEVTDPCIQHAVKKLLVAGGRGSKDVDKDIQEAMDSLLRWREMRKEDGALGHGGSVGSGVAKVWGLPPAPVWPSDLAG